MDLAKPAFSKGPSPYMMTLVRQSGLTLQKVTLCASNSAALCMTQDISYCLVGMEIQHMSQNPCCRCKASLDSQTAVMYQT